MRIIAKIVKTNQKNVLLVIITLTYLNLNVHQFVLNCSLEMILIIYVSSANRAVLSVRKLWEIALLVRIIYFLIVADALISVLVINMAIK